MPFFLSILYTRTFLEKPDINTSYSMQNYLMAKNFLPRKAWDATSIFQHLWSLVMVVVQFALQTAMDIEKD